MLLAWLFIYSLLLCVCELEGPELNPMYMFPSPAVNVDPANLPKATLLCPDINVLNANPPIATELLSAFELNSDLCPTATL